MSKYFNTQFRIEAGYEWGKGMPEYKTRLFYNDIILAFVRRGWTVEPIRCSNCVYVIKEKTRLYVHPMELTGACKEEHVEEVKTILIMNCSTCSLEAVKVMEEIQEPDSKERIESAVRKLVAGYKNKSEVCLGEFLASEKVDPTLSYEDAFNTYVTCMKNIEGDKFTVTKEGITEDI